MSADVETIRRYQASCPDCGFWGAEHESQEAADEEADLHDHEHHEEADR